MFVIRDIDRFLQPRRELTTIDYPEITFMSDPATLRRARRMGTIQVSEIVQLSEAAAVMRREGRDVIGLATGEPDFDTPPHVLEAAAAAMHAGDTHYPPTGGTPALKHAVCERLGADHGIDVGARGHRLHWRQAGAVQRLHGHPRRG